MFPRGGGGGAFKILITGGGESTCEIMCLSKREGLYNRRKFYIAVDRKPQINNW